MISRTLQYTLQEFSSNFFPERKKLNEDFKLFEMLVNYIVLSRILPDVFDDKAVFDLVDVDKDGDSSFGIDAFSLIINDTLITEIEQIEEQRISKRLDVRFIFIQSKYTTSLGTDGFLKFTSAVKDLLSQKSTLPKSNSISKVKLLIDEVYSLENAKLFKGNMPQCEMYYANAGSIKASDLLSELIKKEEREIGSTLDIKNCNIRQINEKYIIDSWSEIENRKEVNIELSKIISCNEINNVEQAYIGYLDVAEFFKIITGIDGRIRKNIFYENVRDYQGSDNQVNAEIKSTLNDNSLLDEFVLLNNGITIVAKEFSNIKSNQYQMNDYYVVNGCQTSNVLFENRESINNSHGLDVPIKIIHTEKNDVIERIIRSTNRQTPVPDEAFVSFNAFHKELQKFYKTFDLPTQRLYYERRSGEYRNDSGIEKQRVIGLHSQIRLYVSTILGFPYLVSTRNPSAILKEYEDKIFQENHSYYPYYLASYLNFWFFQLVDMEIISREYIVSRSWICWIARIYLTKSVKAKTDATSNEYYDGIIHDINSPEALIDLFQTACVVFDVIKEEYKSQTNTNSTNKSLIRMRDFCNSVKEYIEKRNFV